MCRQISGGQTDRESSAGTDGPGLSPGADAGVAASPPPVYVDPGNPEPARKRGESEALVEWSSAAFVLWIFLGQRCCGGESGCGGAVPCVGRW